MRKITVNDNWHLRNVREYLSLRYNLNYEYSFVIDSSVVRKRKEKSMFCKDISFPQYISLKRGPQI